MIARFLSLAIALAAAAPASSETLPIVASPEQAAPTARTVGADFLASLDRLDGLESYIADRFAPNALTERSASERAADYARLVRQTGGFSVLSSNDVGPRMAELIVRAKRDGRYARIVVATSARAPGKVTNIFIFPERDPARVQADRFPTGAVGADHLRALIRTRIDALAEEDSFSGAVLVAKGDTVLLREARGKADAAWNIPNRTDTRFHIASVGKMWTAVVIMKLVDDGKMSLDDRLDRWVPDFPHREAAARITVRDLLGHRAGLGIWDGRHIGDLPPRKAAASMTAAPAAAGASFSYSNAGYVLLSAAAEAASGETFESLVERIVFEPAGMKASGFWPVTAVVPNRARGYLRPDSDPLGYEGRLANEQYLGFKGGGSGGGYSTVDDMFAFHRALAGGKLIGAASREAMVSQASDFAGTPRPARYGLGLRLEPCAGVPTLGHSGGGAGSGVSASTFSTLDGEWTVVVLGNVDPVPEQLAFDICTLVHQR